MIVTGLLLLALGLFLGLLAFCVWLVSDEEPEEATVNPEKALETALELHAIRRRLDVAWTRSQQKADAARMRRRIAKELEVPAPPDKLNGRPGQAP